MASQRSSFVAFQQSSPSTPSWSADAALRELLLPETEAGCPAAPSLPCFRVLPLTELRPGSPRLLQGLGTNSLPRFLRRATSVALEIGGAAVADRLLPPRPAPMEVEEGRARPGGGSFALYLHWSPDGRISELVRRQVLLWRAQGFAVVFISNAAPPAPDWDAIADHAVLRVRRGNAGRDFGAWRDGLRLVEARFGRPAELLLANDSVLGPFAPLDPLVAAWRASGEGLFGMTESLAGGPHLQSYALLARGAGPIASLADHLAKLPDSASKWRLVQRGEIGLSHRMLKDRQFCGALFDYPSLCGMVDRAERRALGPRFARADALWRFPLNPTHHLWRPLVTRMGFPYLKRELIRRMPDPLSPRAAWREVVPAPWARLIEDHMRLMQGG
ncbi:hypothetical protein [Falsiroseomonas sp.]|uniref:hypothetical protein n=1 Tax=Falsiroseomonas sp. TaxID=2870721 RepID=UPI00356AB867